MDTVEKLMYGWEAAPWRTIERRVFKLQKRIYQASERGDTKTVHNLQRLLMKSQSAKYLATRRVTQDNQGKKTAGIDGIKSLTPRQRLALVKGLEIGQKAKPVRRVWIPKPGTTEKRGLGIPVMYDRACQALVKLALEPEWEAKFETNSYGFRPGRSCHDAIEAIRLSIRIKPKFVLDADIAKCFDRINQEALLTKLATFPTLKRIIKMWLKAGVMDGDTLFPTEEGTPQGGVVSPLLANIALHGLETAVKSAFKTQTHTNGKLVRNWQPTLLRYCDDFVILHQDLTVIEQAKQIVAEWLKGMSLELKPSKTRITHTLNQYDGEVGFDFLGFTVRQYPVGKTHSGKTGRKNSQLLGYKTLIKPSKMAIRRHSLKIKEVIRKHKATTQGALIKELNPIIRGWANYYARGNSKETFSRMDYLTYNKLLSWAKFRHHNKSAHWIATKYWHPEQGKWNFATSTGKHLLQYASTPVKEHVKVQGNRTPFDGDWVYWATRLGKHPELPARIAKLLKWQKGKCTWCGLYFKNNDVLELDHIIPKIKGGKDEYENWQLLHRHCHDTKTAIDGSTAGRGTHKKSQTVEEPCEVKVSRTVLKPSEEGDLSA
jgi:RNA-directed DNA polymerase